MTHSAEPRAADPPGLALAPLSAYLAQHALHAPFAGGALSAELIAGGKSNLTYVLRRDAGSRSVGAAPGAWVLRRPPLGHVLATAHDMAREYRVLSALAPTGVPVPEVYHLCQDPEVIGAPFYVMELVEGTVYRDRSQTAQLTPGRARALSWALVDVLADLHAVDPVRVGLADFGRPEGYLERQVARWGKQLAASRNREVPGIDELHEALGTAVPQPQRAAIVHGDYRLDNVIVDENDRIAAVLDWEMATLGDPLADVGLLCVYWTELESLGGAAALTSAVDSAAGFPGQEQLVARYAARSGLDVARLPWYTAFGYFKLAVIAEGIHFRYLSGQTVGSGFEGMGGLVPALVRRGLDTLAAG
ncbi:phosphotransferase family protein [Actinocrinis puniceicyclus]|uniref:Phosphotransferase family protein n=1 Tax=Actinocrinis puniceicyclus TaxID=977794 RepID=A0A8J7WIH2_9ACTN|nr:phosphotransferase family protein [Actinocrinis puniceicyclus]MBS2961923.1 phosphotransferase family protein [Actinocrinis puniceicyclus]